MRSSTTAQGYEVGQLIAVITDTANRVHPVTGVCIVQTNVETRVVAVPLPFSYFAPYCLNSVVGILLVGVHVTTEAKPKALAIIGYAEFARADIGWNRVNSHKRTVDACDIGWVRHAERRRYAGVARYDRASRYCRPLASKNINGGARTVENEIAVADKFVEERALISRPLSLHGELTKYRKIANPHGQVIQEDCSHEAVGFRNIVLTTPRQRFRTKVIVLIPNLNFNIHERRVRR